VQAQAQAPQPAIKHQLSWESVRQYTAPPTSQIPNGILAHLGSMPDASAILHSAATMAALTGAAMNNTAAVNSARSNTSGSGSTNGATNSVNMPAPANTMATDMSVYWNAGGAGNTTYSNGTSVTNQDNGNHGNHGLRNDEISETSKKFSLVKLTTSYFRAAVYHGSRWRGGQTNNIGSNDDSKQVRLVLQCRKQKFMIIFFQGGSGSGARGKYRCGRCGLPKVKE
jgi:hypothetical protein